MAPMHTASESGERLNEEGNKEVAGIVESKKKRKGGETEVQHLYAMSECQ